MGLWLAKPFRADAHSQELAFSAEATKHEPKLLHAWHENGSLTAWRRNPLMIKTF